MKYLSENYGLVYHIRLLHSRIWILIIFLIFIIGGCSKDELSDIDSGKIKTGQKVQLIKQNIPVQGGTVIIGSGGGILEGMKITVPSGAYNEETEMEISYAEIESHEFGELFNPVSPLIEIKNGGKNASELMNLHIPVSGDPETYKMAFYYDKATGELEGISVVRSGVGFIDISVRHFSFVVITEIQKQLLIDGGGFHTLFDPKINGWSFVNYGTFPEYEGICAGMSIGAAYYYKNFKSQLPLNSFFDNDLLWFPTKEVWEDDATGLQFATSIHRIQKSFWDHDIKNIDSIISASPEDRLFNILYALLVLNQPQLIYVDDPAATHAHMIVAFGYEINGQEVRINVYDPNFPNQESTINYDLSTHTFAPYTSAQNAYAMQNNQLFSYRRICFIPFSSVMTTDEMNFLWQKVQNKTIGQGIFPAMKIFAVPKDNTFQKIELNIADNSKTNYIPFKDFDFEVEGLDAGLGLKMEAISYLPGFGWERINPAQTITMNNPDTLIGLFLKAKPQNNPYDHWLGYEWFKIQLQSFWIEPYDTTVAVNAGVEFIARHNGTAPNQAIYKWDFGDGNKDSSSDSTIIYKYDQPGEFEIELIVIDAAINKEVAKITGKINVVVWPKIAITLKGMESSPPSTIKADNGSDIPSIGWSNKVSTIAPALRWNKTDFTVDFSFNLGEPVYTCHISGQMSEDFKTIKSLVALFTGIGFGGDWTYESGITLHDFPVEEYVPGSIIGKELSGMAAFSKVGILSWKQASKDAQGNVTEIKLQSVDWNSDQTKLSVYFYNK